MALIIDAPMPKGKCWWEENGVEHECHLFPCWGNADNCPIIGEIPDKHGRLIDADALCNKLKSPDFAYFSVARFESLITEAETIVETTE